MNKFKNAFEKFTARLQPEESSQAERISYPNVDTHGGTSGRIAWPPRFTAPPNVLGEVTDLTGHTYKRDIGRSIQLGGHTYYVFGDTFCHQTRGEFCGVTNNTIALVPSLNNPLGCRYLTSDVKVPEFVPLSEEEKQYGRWHENMGENKRYVNWTFGGVIEKPGNGGNEGWLFYDTVEVHGAQPVKQCGTGVASVKVTDSETGHIECERVGRFPLFDPEDPLWGNMSNIAAPDGWTYLLSGKGLDNFMARIRTDADFENPSNYQFLKKGGEWVSSYQGPHGPFGELAHDVLQGQGQGAIVYMPDYAPEGKPYMWFGCEKFPTSKMWVGAAPRPEGPWELHDMGEMPRVEPEHSRLRYCIYPHIWGSSPGRGKMLISWTDNGTMGGKVFMGYFNFATL
jgi:hypothetical protein